MIYSVYLELMRIKKRNKAIVCILFTKRTLLIKTLFYTLTIRYTFLCFGGAVNTP